MITAVTAALVGGTAFAAGAITGGQLDGNRHPNVGLIAFYDAEGRFRCSASLVTDRVLLTAAHCTTGTLGRTAVTFDSVVAQGPPTPLPVAAHPTQGYTQAEFGGRWLPVRPGLRTRTTPAAPT